MQARYNMSGNLARERGFCIKITNLKRRKENNTTHVEAAAVPAAIVEHLQLQNLQLLYYETNKFWCFHHKCTQLRPSSEHRCMTFPADL